MRSRNLSTKIGVVVSIVMGLFPPWVHKLDVRGASVSQPASYSLIFDPPVGKTSLWSVRIDFPRLLLQLAIIWGIVAAIHYFAKGKNSGNPPE